MSATTFAKYAKSSPPAPIGMHGLTCHVAGMYWMFRELGKTANAAMTRIEQIGQTTCPACTGGGAVHLSITHEWYGANMCMGYTAIAGRFDCTWTAEVGDVILIGGTHPVSTDASGAPLLIPAHTMIVVGKAAGVLKIRGYNNTGTLGTGGHLQYDNADRDINSGPFWHTQGGITRFGQSFAAGGSVYRVSYAQYYANARAVAG